MKKNLVKGLVIGTAALGMAGLYNNNTSAESYIIGDVNLDGKVDLMDAQKALKAALRIDSLDGISTKTADINEDGRVDLADAQGILKLALRITTNDTIISDEEEAEPTEQPVTPSEPTESATEEPAGAPFAAWDLIKDYVSSYDILEDGTIIVTTKIIEKCDWTGKGTVDTIITTPDEGIEGVDWEWRISNGGYVLRCNSCEKCLSLVDHGYPDDEAHKVALDHDLYEHILGDGLGGGTHMDWEGGSPYKVRLK